jgi:hypothetical protein
VSGYDATRSKAVDSFLATLSPEEYAEWELVYESFLQNPLPDGTNTVPLDHFPYPPDTYGHSSGSFSIVFRFLNRYVLEIFSVYWSPDSPKHPAHQLM